MPKVSGPLIRDVASQAGVSTATVDRVLNRRPGVRERTARRVLAAAAELGYIAEERAQSDVGPRPQRLVFLLPAGGNLYLKQLGETVKQAAARPSANGQTIRCLFVDSFDPIALSEALSRHGERADGVAFMAVDHPLVRERVAELRMRGRHVLTLVSDIGAADRLAYIGLDNRSVGRTAALMMGRMIGAREGVAALIAASRSYRAHEEREMGFRGLMAERFPQISVVEAREGHDDSDENYRHTLRLLEAHPELIGVYNVGGSSNGVARALREKGRAHEVLFIGHGLTADTRRYLLDETMDLVITQSAEAIVRNALLAFDNIRRGAPPQLGVEPLTMELVVRENLR